PGARGLRLPELVRKKSFLTGAETYKSVTIQCPEGKFAISGGAIMDGDDGNVYITESTPQSGSPGAPQDNWFIGANQEEGVASGNWSIDGFAVCVKIG
ncbi:MAG TPA: hypothetical protein VLI04_22255, partial [Nocardioidaceae bacterium]|nr:hypothetical protein [Nocardioidaceae bacterium]